MKSMIGSQETEPGHKPLKGLSWESVEMGGAQDRSTKL